MDDEFRTGITRLVYEIAVKVKAEFCEAQDAKVRS